MMQKTDPELPLPPAWRVVFNDIVDLPSESELYLRLRGLAEGEERAFPAEQMGRWDVDQDKGAFVGTLTDGRTLDAKVAILGTHDGNDFAWSDTNPSIKAGLTAPAQALRANLPGPLAVLGTHDRCKISGRDSVVLMALASEMVPCDAFIALRSGDRQIYMLLSDVIISDATPAPSAGLMGRLFGKKPAPTSVQDQLAQLRRTVDAALNQWQKNLLSVADLTTLEPIFVRAHAAMRDGNPKAASDHIAQAIAQMGDFPADQEPTGFAYLCDGLAAAQIGDTARAQAAFAVAERAIIPPPATVLRLARARAAAGRERHTFVLQAYLGNPDLFLTMASQDEQDIVSAALAQATAGRTKETAEQALKLMIAALYENELNASQRSNVAAAKRTEAHVMCDADHLATQQTTQDYVSLLLTFAQPPKYPKMGSFSSDPTAAPDRIVSIATGALTDTTAEFRVVFENPAFKWQDVADYNLRRDRIPLSDQLVWRLESIYFGADENRYAMF